MNFIVNVGDEWWFRVDCNGERWIKMEIVGLNVVVNINLNVIVHMIVQEWYYELMVQLLVNLEMMVDQGNPGRVVR